MNNQSNESIKEALKKIYGERNIQLLESNEDAFDFGCKACGECCFNRNDGQTIMLSPYDVYRLLKHYKRENQAVEDFIERNIGFYIGENSGLPIAKLKTKDVYSGLNICTFLKKDSTSGKFKCKVHEYKPSACRIFPLGRISSTSTENDSQEIHYFLQKDVACGQTENPDQHTLDEWIPDRLETEAALTQYALFQKQLAQIINLPGLKESSIEERVKECFYNVYISSFFANLNPALSFDENFEKASTDILKVATALVEMFSTIDKAIKPKF